MLDSFQKKLVLVRLKSINVRGGEVKNPLPVRTRGENGKWLSAIWPLN